MPRSKHAGLCITAILFALFAFFFPLRSWAAQPGKSAEYSLTFGHHVPEAVARRIAETTAWLAALKNTTDALSVERLVQWGANGAVDRQALVSAVFTPTVSSMSKGWQVLVRVSLIAPLHTVEDCLRKMMLYEQEMLKLRAELLALEREKAEEALRLIELSAALRRNAAGGSSENRSRIDLLAGQLEALWLLGTVLPQREAGLWRDPKAGLPVLQQAAALYPDYAPLHCLEGEILLQLDRPQDALAKLDKALTLNPELAGALFARGLAYLRLNLPALAERDLSAALARDSSQAAWWRARGALRMVRNETILMCEDFMQACARGDCEGLALTRDRGLCSAEK